MARRQVANVNSLTNTQLSYTVTQDTIEITDQTITTEGQVFLALNLAIPNAPRIVGWGMASSNPGFNFTSQFKLLLTPMYLYGNSSFLLNNASVAGKERLRVWPNGVNSGDQPTGMFCYDGGGTGNDYAYQNGNGERWLIKDIGTLAASMPTVGWDPNNEEFTVQKSDALGYDDITVYDSRGNNCIILRPNTGVGQEDLYVNEGTPETEQIIQDSGSDITVTGAQSVGGSAGDNPLEQFWLPLYYNVNSEVPVYERLQHNGGGGQVPLDIDIPLFAGSTLGGFQTCTYNAQANTDGVPVYYDNGFLADIGDGNGTVGINPFAAPNSLTKL